MKTTRSWDIFCKVIDNYGDIGVSWRLAVHLAARGHGVRLWVDDARALAWMAPGAGSGAFPGIRVLPWAMSANAAALADLQPADVWIEGFGCELEPAFVARRFAAAANTADDQPPPVWINLEYLSAEPYAARAHGLPSPILTGLAKGHTRWFFYPGFTESTGGLIREAGLEQRRAAFDRADWFAHLGVPWAGEHLVSLFCYEPPALAELLAHYQHSQTPTLMLVTQGRAAAAVKRHWALELSPPDGIAVHRRGALSLVLLAALAQTDFDRLLWACDMNFVRGEDSLVRALWATRPFVWQIYPQHDDAHHAKLHAVLDALDAPPSWRRFHLAWNGMVGGPLPQPEPGPWGDAVRHAAAKLATQPDLTTRLVQFVDKLSAPLLQTSPKDR